MKAVLFCLVLLISAIVAFIAWYRYDSAQNRGYEFGYYGDFNRVSNALLRIPNIRIAGSFANCDVTLEEFGFELLRNSDEVIRVAFGEEDPRRELNRERLLQALKKEVESAVPLWRTNLSEIAR